MRIINIFLITGILTMLSGCNYLRTHTKEFAVEGYEHITDYYDAPEERDTKSIEDSELIYIRYRCLKIRSVHDSYAYLIIENKTDSEIKILKVHWEHIFKGKSLVNIYPDLKKNEYERKVPFILTKNDDYVLFHFNTQKNRKNFKGGDKINIIVEVEYEIDGVKYTVNADFNIVCQKESGPPLYYENKARNAGKLIFSFLLNKNIK